MPFDIPIATSLLQITAHPLPLMHNRSQSPRPRRIRQIIIVRHAKLMTQFLRAKERQNDHIREHAAHEDADDFAVIIPLRLAQRRKRVPLADRGLDRRGGGGDEVAKLVGRADDEGAEGAGGEFHEVDGDDAPCALHAELLEEGGRYDLLVADEGVRVEQRAADDGDEDDAEAAAEDLRGVPDHGPAGHGAEVGHDLRHGDGVGGEAVLVFDHEWVQVLGAVGHEVEACHEEDEVDEEEPVSFQRYASFGEEGAGDASVRFPHSLPFSEGSCLWQAESENDDQHWWAGAEPVERTPAMGCSIDKTSCESCG